MGILQYPFFVRWGWGYPHLFRLFEVYCLPSSLSSILGRSLGVVGGVLGFRG